MTAVAIALCMLCQVFLVIGQVLLKRGMNATPHPETRRRGWAIVAAGTACLAAWFFLWIGLLQTWELSRLFPFEGLNPALLVLAAWLFLRERVPAIAWGGIVLICLGVMLVSSS